MKKVSDWSMHIIGLLLVVAFGVIAAMFLRPKEYFGNSADLTDFTGLAFFTSNNCVHCTRLKPVINDLQTAYPDKVKIVDCTNPDETVSQLMTTHKVNAFPTILKFNNGSQTEAVEDRDFKSLEKMLQ